MLVTLSGITISSKLLQYSNAYSPIETTPLGRMISFKLLQFRNAQDSMEVTPSGIVTLCKPVQPLNAVPMEITLSGRITCSRLLQSLKALLSPIVPSASLTVPSIPLPKHPPVTYPSVYPLLHVVKIALVSSYFAVVFAKEPGPSKQTECGTFMTSSPVQLAKPPAYMPVTPSVTVTVFKLLGTNASLAVYAPAPKI